MKQHPLSAAFPAMDAEEFSELVEDVRKNGLRTPILIMDGMVLDGWHRYTACRAAGMTPRTLAAFSVAEASLRCRDGIHSRLGIQKKNQPERGRE